MGPDCLAAMRLPYKRGLGFQGLKNSTLPSRHLEQVNHKLPPFLSMVPIITLANNVHEMIDYPVPGTVLSAFHASLR